MQSSEEGQSFWFWQGRASWQAPISQSCPWEHWASMKQAVRAMHTYWLQSKPGGH